MEYIIQFNRTISLETKTRILFGRVLYKVGWVFLLIGFFLSIMVSTMIDWSSFHSTGSLIEVKGKVISVSPTNVKINKTRVYSISYNFILDAGELANGTSYVTGDIFKAGESVSILYTEGKTENSKIVGTRSKPLPPESMFIYLLPLIGVILTYLCLRNYANSVYLLSKGILTDGLLISKIKTNLSENEKTVYQLTFQYIDHNNNTHFAYATSSQPESLEDEYRELLLYDPKRPENALMIDSIKGKTTIDDQKVQTRKSSIR